MSDESTASPRIRFVVRVAQEFEFEAASLADAYDVMVRLGERTDERATLTDHHVYLAPKTDDDAALLKGSGASPLV